jgi:hypothetical protein
MTPNEFLETLQATQDNFYVAAKGDNVQKIRGAWSRVAARLYALNSVGYEIWYAVHAFQADAPAKSSEYVSEYRCHYADVDQVGAPPPHSLPTPSLVVESSPGKRQYLWLLEPTAVSSYPEWGGVQAWLVSQVPGSDPVAKDAARVLRLPGFVNHKYPGRPTVKVLQDNPITYSPGDFLAIAPKMVPVAPVFAKPGGDTDKVLRYLESTPAPGPGSGLRNPWVFRVAAWAVRDLGVDSELIAEMVHDKMEREQGHRSYDFSKIRQIVQNAARFSRGVRGFEAAPDVEVV